MRQDVGVEKSTNMKKEIFSSNLKEIKIYCQNCPFRQSIMIFSDNYLIIKKYIYKFAVEILNSNVCFFNKTLRLCVYNYY